jgi:hypothetical protein
MFIEVLVHAGPLEIQPRAWNHFPMALAIPKAAILSMVGPIALLLTGYLGWRFYGAKALDSTYYALKKENIHISDPPPWLRSDVVAEVFSESGLERMSLLDDQTSAVIAKAFDTHPWVRKTHRVQRMAAGQIMVNLEFRQPIAMVHCLSDAPLQESTPTGASSDLPSGVPTSAGATPDSAGQESFLPVDTEGVLLPTKDFSQADIANYLLIYGQNIKAVDYPRVGMVLGDSQIQEAIMLARLVEPMRSSGQLKLSSIYVYPSGASPRSRWKLELTTKGGPRILWGSPPGKEASGEPTANSKLKRLVELARDPKRIGSAEVDLTQVLR